MTYKFLFYLRSNKGEEDARYCACAYRQKQEMMTEHFFTKDGISVAEKFNNGNETAYV
jgi:hypothetical protein